MNTIQTKIVKEICQQLSGVIAIYSFGSWGTAQQRANSDIDLAVLLQKPENSTKIWEVAQKIAQITGKDIDLVDLLNASTVMRSQVITTARRIHCSDEQECEKFEDYVYTAYARLNEERAQILNDIKQRGTVCG